MDSQLQRPLVSVGLFDTGISGRQRDVLTT